MRSHIHVDRRMNLNVDQFEAYLRAVKAPNTAKKYAAEAERFLEFLEQRKIDMNRLPPGIIQHYAAFLVEHQFQSASIHVMIAGARSYLEWCRGQGESIPTLNKTDLPKVHNREPNALKNEALLQYLALASRAKEPFRSALLLLPYCGLRSEEIATVSISAIRTVSLPIRGGGHQKHVVMMVRGKGSELRVAPVIFDGRALLAKYLRDWRRHQGGTWLFQMPDGSHLATRTLRHYVQKIRETIGVQRLTPHTLRRTYATTLWRMGVDDVTLTKAMGHRALATTQKHYLDVSPEDVVGGVSRALIVRGPEDQLQEAHRQMTDYMEQQRKPR